MTTSPADMQAAKRLLTEVIDSFEKLEIAVHVHGSGFAPPVASDVAKALGIPLDEVTKCLKALGDAGVLDPRGVWRGPLDSLVRMYGDDRIDVLNLMTRTALDRVRKEAARVFADAFVIKPTKKKGDPDA